MVMVCCVNIFHFVVRKLTVKLPRSQSNLETTNGMEYQSNQIKILLIIIITVSCRDVSNMIRDIVQ